MPYILYVYIYTLNLDKVSTVSTVKQTDISIAPKFTKLSSMNGVILMYNGNMMELNCEAEGKYQVYKFIRILVVRCFSIFTYLI